MSNSKTTSGGRRWGKARGFYDTPGRVKPMGDSRSSNEVITTKPDGTVVKQTIANRHHASLTPVMGTDIARSHDPRTKHWDRVWAEVRERDKGVCQCCHRVLASKLLLVTDQEHGGQVRADNAVASCIDCYFSRTHEERQTAYTNRMRTLRRLSHRGVPDTA